MNERVKELRKSLDLTLDKFGKRLGVSNAAISRIENGINSITEQMLKAICREFNVNEEWLRDGKGEMFKVTSDNYFRSLKEQFKLDNLDLAILNTYLSLDSSKRNIIKDYILSVADRYKQTEEEQKQAEIDAEVEAYRKELEAESKGETSFPYDASKNAK